MADNTVVHIGENSPEQVAFKLMEKVANAEDKHFIGSQKNTDRAWILDTYAECLQVVKARRTAGPSGPSVRSI